MNKAYLIQTLRLFICFFALTLLSCSQKKKPFPAYQSSNLEIKALSDNLYLHISFLETKEYGKVPCNGVVYINNNEAIIIDAPTNDSASLELLKWIGNTKIKAVVATHFHIDCTGGLDAFHQKGIQSIGLNKTINLAKVNQEIIPKESFNLQKDISVGGAKVELRYFGEGHTQDNIVAYIPSEKVLFGGCLIKAEGSSKGNLADANIASWPMTVSKVKKEYPNVKIVVPGHGAPGSKTLLDYTQKLLN